jgi:hypothetical protein
MLNAFSALDDDPVMSGVALLHGLIATERTIDMVIASCQTPQPGTGAME